jgi:hypothetical protein
MPKIGVVDKSWLTCEHSLDIIKPEHLDPIVIMGLPRSGTSRIAGVLHLLGVYMGSRFPATNDDNPRGFFEDKDLTELIDFAQTEYITKEELAVVLKYMFISRKSLGNRWGFKTHRVVRYFDIIEDLCPDAKIIYTIRDTDSNIDSIAKCYNIDRDTAQEYAQIMMGEIEAICSRQTEVMVIPLERSITENDLMVKGIIDYCELSGILMESLEATMFYLNNYKNTEVWPLSKTISVPNWGRSDKVQETDLCPTLTPNLSSTTSYSKRITSEPVDKLPSGEQ